VSEGLRRAACTEEFNKIFRVKNLSSGFIRASVAAEGRVRQSRNSRVQLALLVIQLKLSVTSRLELHQTLACSLNANNQESLVKVTKLSLRPQSTPLETFPHDCLLMRRPRMVHKSIKLDDDKKTPSLDELSGKR
jgi:hypothetical protein